MVMGLSSSIRRRCREFADDVVPIGALLATSFIQVSLVATENVVTLLSLLPFSSGSVADDFVFVNSSCHDNCPV